MLDDFIHYAPPFFALCAVAYVATAAARSRVVRTQDEARARRAIAVGDQWEQIQTRLDYAVAAVQRNEEDNARLRSEIDQIRGQLTTMRRQLRTLPAPDTGEHERIESTNPGVPPNSHRRR